MKVCFETFGCRLNRAEALETEARYVAAGWTVEKSHAEADVIVVRGCSVTAKAERDCARMIEHLKHKYPTKRLVVEGCYRQREGVHSPPETADALPGSTARAYLKIQDGCDGRCTFCIVPQFRGKGVSTPLQSILDRARRFVDAGYREIVVTGCNLSQYLSGGKRLPDVLDALTGLGECRIRLGSLEPGAVALDTVGVMAERKNACRFLHLPVQSGSSRILVAMKRPYSMRNVQELVRLATERMPALGLGCDLMTGFPGETEIDFLATRGLLKRLPFSNAHVFPYSERPGTPAARMGNAVPTDIRSGRARILSAKASEKREAFARQFLGKTVEIVVEDAERIGGWTGEYLWCSVCPDVGASLVRRPERKSLLRLRVTQVKGDRLQGAPCPGS